MNRYDKWIIEPRGVVDGTFNKILNMVVDMFENPEKYEDDYPDVLEKLRPYISSRYYLKQRRMKDGS